MVAIRQSPDFSDPGTFGNGMAALLERVAARDRVAFRELYLYSSPRLYGVALALTRDRQIAAEALQDAMVEIWNKAARYDASRGTPEAWMAGILRFRAFDLLRGGRAARSETSVEDHPELTDDAALERLETTASGIALRRCLGRLEEVARRALILGYTYGYSQSQIAREMRVPLGTVKSHMRRSLSALKACLDP